MTLIFVFKNKISKVNKWKIYLNCITWTDLRRIAQLICNFKIPVSFPSISWPPKAQKTRQRQNRVMHLNSTIHTSGITWAKNLYNMGRNHSDLLKELSLEQLPVSFFRISRISFGISPLSIISCLICIKKKILLTLLQVTVSNEDIQLLLFIRFKFFLFRASLVVFFSYFYFKQ